MNYDELLKAARACIGTSCKVCPVCSGIGCRNRIPGPGSKGVGDTPYAIIRNGRRSGSIWILCMRMRPWIRLFPFLGKPFRILFLRDLWAQ